MSMSYDESKIKLILNKSVCIHNSRKYVLFITLIFQILFYFSFVLFKYSELAPLYQYKTNLSKESSHVPF
jgi:hypothetical protein